jgi:hypothetical protein
VSVVEAHDLERLRRSLAMLSPSVKATVLSREEAMALVAELADVKARLERVRAGLRALLEDAGPGL